MRRKPVVVGLLLAVALTGCGGTDTPPGPGREPPAANKVESLPDPCTLVTKEEAGTAVAGAVADGVHELVSTPTLGDGRDCTMKSSGEGVAMITTFANLDRYDLYKVEQSQFGRVTELPGVGDKAFTVGNGGCFVVKGAVSLEVRMRPADGFKTDPTPRMIVLCKQAAGRLP